MSANLHDRDFFAWTQEQAALLRAGRIAGADVGLLAEEIEDMGKEQRNAIRSLLRLILVHLLKLRLSGAVEPRAGWAEELVEFRAQLADRLDDNPSLRAQLDELFATAWPSARRAALAAFAMHREEVDIPLDCPFRLADVLDDQFFA